MENLDWSGQHYVFVCLFCLSFFFLYFLSWQCSSYLCNRRRASSVTTIYTYIICGHRSKQFQNPWPFTFHFPTKFGSKSGVRIIPTIFKFAIFYITEMVTFLFFVCLFVYFLSCNYTYSGIFRRQRSQRGPKCVKKPQFLFC